MKKLGLGVLWLGFQGSTCMRCRVAAAPFMAQWEKQWRCRERFESPRLDCVKGSYERVCPLQLPTLPISHSESSHVILFMPPHSFYSPLPVFLLPYTYIHYRGEYVDLFESTFIMRHFFVKSKHPSCFSFPSYKKWGPLPVVYDQFAVMVPVLLSFFFLEILSPTLISSACQHH